MHSQEQIIEFIKGKTGIDKLNPGDDLLQDHGVSGDDFHELIENYRKSFNVDMSTYRWYFHADEEGNNTGGIFFKPPHQRVQRIPVTPAMLCEFANKLVWDIHYPDHKIPKHRWDLLINILILVTVLSWTLYSCLR
jgi:hypothetical protein